MDAKNILAKLRQLPERHKWIILMSIIGVIALGLGSLWIVELERSVPKIAAGLSEIKLPAITIPDASGSQQSSETTYQNNQYHFSFQYPNGMQIQETTDKNLFVTQVQQNSQVILQVSVFPNQTISEDVVSNNVQVGNATGDAVKENTSETNPCLGILLQHDGNSYVIDDGCLAKNYQPLSDATNQTDQQILSTFSLTDTTSPTQ